MLDHFQNQIRSRLLGAFICVASVLGVHEEATAQTFSPLYDTKMPSGESIRPTRFVNTNTAWVVGEDLPLFLEGDQEQGVVDPLQQQFFTSSLVKPLVYLAVMRQTDEDQKAVAAGTLKPEDALTDDSVLVISDYASQLTGHRSFEEEVIVGEAKTMLLSFSLNDVALAFAERIANGGPVDANISVADSKKLEERFVLEHMRPIAKELGMDDTFLVNATGLPTYAAGKTPTWKNNVSTPDDMMRLFNHIFEKYPEYIALSSHAELHVPMKTAPFKNSNPLLENSTRGAEDKVQAMPVDGVVCCKTGLSDTSLWVAMVAYDLSQQGGEGYLAILSTGNDNEEYATVPQDALEKGIEIWREREFGSDLDFDADLKVEPVVPELSSGDSLDF